LWLKEGTYLNFGEDGGVKLNMLVTRLLLLPRNNRPSRVFLFLPPSEFKLPIGTTIPPKMDVNIEQLGIDAPFGSNEEASHPRSNQEMKVAWTNASNVIPTRGPSKNGVQCHTNRFLGEPKRRSVKNR
jgi:hypothetical protein